MKSTRLYILVAFLGIAIDQAVKAWVRGAIPIQGSMGGRPWPGVFEITLTYNEGIAFGMLQGRGVLLTPIAMLIAGGSFWYVWSHPQESRLATVAMGLLGAGAIGNLIDRLWLGHVTDMFWFRLINFPVFNVADACITVATILLILSWWRAPNPASAQTSDGAGTHERLPEQAD